MRELCLLKKLLLDTRPIEGICIIYSKLDSDFRDAISLLFHVLDLDGYPTVVVYFPTNHLVNKKSEVT
jgi:hypothetical protein